MSALNEVRARVAQTCERVGRDPASVRLIAVSKTRSVEEIRALYDEGQRDFGENYLQEALPKIAALPSDIRWHFIGHVQSKKVRAIAEAFDVIHAIDRPSQVAALNKISAPIEVLVALNLVDNPNKSGILPESLDQMVRSLLQCQHVLVSGVMTMGVEGDESATRAIFRSAAALARKLDLPELSMGMSGDMEIAVEEGATMVRIGTALFGPRIEPDA